ncbi:MAG: ABC transporter ATP-binding protein [Candidatus Bipolaricaulota bacterium]|nr:ABC transporter ATP-binding protein [Candidatus Bipolaricaulota bacterium]MCS7274263.1 ABC transporter ATP-binding protein [Candidatus Bipolaricaulota bacterium]MDW8111047.1 ABC transporter ATP-binding protein [Candidatus Bipolaricaulota bacterium]MDW8329766.1 ABC transporter ATP-binding protein [Candidatus Bipolaricaulota bacterium]
MPSEVLLDVRDLVKDFGGLRAVNKCSLSVKRGTITGLIGPNGAGKTTLFNLITGFYKPDSGHVFFRGEEITGLPPHRIFHKKLCRTFQIPREFKQMTVLENLMLVPAGQRGENLFCSWFLPRLVRRQEAEIRDKALAVLEFVNLIHLKDEYAANLSGGQKKLLELARTLMADPEMVLLDEPGAGVNPTLMKQLVANIEKLCYERGVTFLLIEHDMDLVMNLCNPVIVMSNGEKLAEGTPQEIQRDERVLEAYLGSQYRAAVRE